MSLIDEKNKVKQYVSRQGFEEVPLVRGFTEIQWLYENLVEKEKGVYLLGGYARYCASPRVEPVVASDVDIYCEDEDVFQQVKEFFKILRQKHENPMAISYQRPTEGVLKYCPSIQIIKPILKGRVVAKGDLKTILSNFDFTIIRAAIIDPKIVLVDADFLHDEEHMFLRIKNIHCPISSSLRFMKYCRKGYYTRPLQVYRLFNDWDHRSDDYREKLAEFLQKSEEGRGMSQQEVDELEELMRID